MADTGLRQTTRGADRYEVRAVWTDASDSMVSQSVEHFDTKPMLERSPDFFGVYVVYGGGHIQDHPTRAAAAKHASELNGADQS